ncbi:sugar ABC transporter ATP-binding protein [Halobacteriales archaeon QH_6_64_20]|jgi:multiple sugar transport system ATP-binding protein|nr:MAG: sugar ABC transporter ATP-binding protein [Halobacteriales archaeon QH_6_64_20]
MSMALRDKASDSSADSVDGRGRTIRLENLTKTFNNGQVVAAEDIDLEVRSDEFAVLLGPSGCGKTTTLRCISGLDIPDGGRILIGDETVTEAKPKDRNLAFVFQRISLYPHMSVRENMRFGLDMKTDLTKDEKNTRVEESAEMLGISELLDRKPADLSGGQQQRVSIGRAMVMEPAAFLLDEPFSALDANLRDQMQTEIKRLHRNLETAMVFVTHDQEEAMSLGDKIVIMNDGRIQQVGSPYEIYDEPTNRFVAEFIGSPSTNMIDCVVERQDGEVTLSNETFSLSLPEEMADDLDSNDGETVTLGVRPENINPVPDGLFEAEITLIEPQGSLDTVFLTSDDLDIRALLEKGLVESENTTTGVDFSPEDAWLFGRDGERLL